MSTEEYIRNLSHAKLQTFQQSRVDPPILKYVLIINLLRQQQNKNSVYDGPYPSEEHEGLEQVWLDTCLDALDDDDDLNTHKDQDKADKTIEHQIHLHDRENPGPPLNALEGNDRHHDQDHDSHLFEEKLLLPIRLRAPPPSMPKGDRTTMWFSRSLIALDIQNLSELQKWYYPSFWNCRRSSCSAEDYYN